MKPRFQLETAEPAHVQVERYFHRRIQRGVLRPGQRLPTSPELAAQWGVSCTVVQKALSRLVASGLLDRTPGRGTYVRNGTDKALIGILFGPNLIEESAHFARVMFRNIQREILEHNWTARIYNAFWEFKGISPPVQQLASDLGSYAFKGLIGFAIGDKGFKSVGCNLPIPKVLVEATRKETDFRFDVDHFLRESLRFLAERDRQRVAFVQMNFVANPKQTPRFGPLERAVPPGQPVPEQVKINVRGSMVDIERAIHRRMLEFLGQWERQSRKERAEALLVTDDIVMRTVALALIQRGIKVPDELLVMSQASEGVDLYYGLPVARYEYPTIDFARQIVDLLWKRILGQKEPPLPILIRGRIKEETGSAECRMPSAE